METNFVQFSFRRLGSGLWLDVDAVPGGQQQFAMEHVHRMRVRSEGELLASLKAAGVGEWSSFPVHPIQATVTRSQLIAIGFRGNY